MSPRDREILLMLVAAVNRGDYDDGLEYLDPDVELRPGVLAPDQQTLFRGRDGMKEFLLGASEPWESMSVDREAILEADGGRFLVLDHWTFRGRGGIEIERDLPTVYTFRDGLIVRIDGFVDEEDARRAVGLDRDGPPDRNSRS